MTLRIRPAKISDLETLADLLLADAKERFASDPILWPLDKNPRQKIIMSIKAAMEAAAPPFRQMWLLAETESGVVGVAHSILLPVPPIYAGVFGPPGLIMEDCFVVPDAPTETYTRLLQAAEADLVDAGAQILLGSSVVGGTWAAQYQQHGYTPLTAYFARTGLRQTELPPWVRKAEVADVPAIVTASAVHRQTLFDLHNVFWEPHEEADGRFGAWMQRSLNLTDRDMFVSEEAGQPMGYAISQPATPLHFPTPHDISGVGVIDDFYHGALEDVDRLGVSGATAVDLFKAAEAARAARGNSAILVVCPEDWTSKKQLLTELGYSNAITWHFKWAGAAS